MARHPSSPFPEYPLTDAVQIRHHVVDGKRIMLALRGDATRGFLLERHCRSPDEPDSILRVDAHDREAVAELIDHDPYVAQLGHVYRAMLDTLPPPQPGVTSTAPPDTAFDCDSEAALSALTRRVCLASGATHFFYHGFVANETDAEFVAHDMLIGGPPAWAQRYVDQHWYLNDPALAHARDDTQPLRASSLELRDDHWLNQYASSIGLRSNLFFPAHRRDVASFGLLHVSAPLPAPQGEASMLRHQRQLRGLASELLEWQVLRRRRAVAAALALTRREILALQLVARGGSARHVAEELGLGERAVYQLFTALNRKLDCSHIKVSASKAKQLGLLSDSYISKLV